MAANAQRVTQQPMLGQQQRKWSMTDVTTKGNKLPNRYGLHAVEGFGKSSLSAYFPNPIFIQSRGETGLETLIDSGRLPDTAHLPEIKQWLDLHSALVMLTEQDHPYKTLVIDTVNGLERLAHEYICERDFKSDWGETGFFSYGKGPKAALTEWRMFLQDLDNLRERKAMILVLLFHTKPAKFKNPEGRDYDRYQPDMHEEAWALTHRWLDVVLFGNFVAATADDKQTKKAKGIGGTSRVIYCQRTAAWDAKNRIGLPESIDLTSEPPATDFKLFLDAVKAGRMITPEGGAQ